FQHWFLEFCDALGAARPSPNAADDYCFEKPVHLQRTDWTDGVGRIDCWKAGHVAIEAKGSGGKGSSEIHLRKAFKQLSEALRQPSPYGPGNRSPLKWIRCEGASATQTSVSHAISVM